MSGGVGQYSHRSKTECACAEGVGCGGEMVEYDQRGITRYFRIDGLVVYGIGTAGLLLVAGGR